MRLRNVKGSRETIAANDYVVHNETGMKGHWHELFDNDNPIHIEIGMGKGQFIMELARRNPDINYIGIEKYSSVLVRALEKRELEPEMTNLYFIRMDAEYIENVFAENEVANISISRTHGQRTGMPRDVSHLHIFLVCMISSSPLREELYLRLITEVSLISLWNRFPRQDGSLRTTHMTFTIQNTTKATS
mgnify:CR=1 FL=1